MAIKTFRDILAWQKSYQLTLEIYKITKIFPREEEFGLKSQMRRSSASVSFNIAEGFKRKHLKDSLNFYNIAESSLEELKCQMLLSKDLQYINIKIFNNVYQLSEEVGKILCGWIKIQK